MGRFSLRSARLLRDVRKHCRQIGKVAGLNPFNTKDYSQGQSETGSLPSKPDLAAKMASEERHWFKLAAPYGASPGPPPL